MALTDTVLTLAGLLEIQLPSGTIRLCDGGFVKWGANTFVSHDPLYGTLGAVDSVTEGISDEAPGGSVTLLPPKVSTAAALFQPTAQGKPIKGWIAEVNRATATVVGTPTQQF